MAYRIQIRLGEDVQTISFHSKGRMVTEAAAYAEQGWIVRYLED